jgi:ATP adenylyltransferase
MSFYNQLTAKFDAALSKSHLKLSKGAIDIMERNGIPFQLRIIPSIAKKPVVADQKTAAQKFNPFLPPDPHLLIQQTSDYNLVLNKYSVVPDHFLMCSANWRNQQAPLTPSDFTLAWRLLHLVEEEFICFYNSGLKSGASQPHFHMQFIPVSGARLETFDGKQYGIPISSVISNQHFLKRDNSPQDTIAAFPFKHALALIQSSSFEQSIFEIYRTCLNRVFSPEELLILDGISPDWPEMSPSWPSFNFIMTREWMLLVPRSQELHELNGVKLSVNSLGFVGMILLKSHDEARALLDPIQLLKELAYST